MSKPQRIFYLSTIFLIAGCQQPPHQEYSIEQIMNTVSIRGSSFSADESSILVSSNENGIFNAYEISISSGETKPLTKSEGNSVFSISYFPNDDRILYRGDQGGNEVWHIYLRNLDGSVVDLTPAENERAIFYKWGYDKQSFFYGSNKRNPQFMDVYEMDINNFKAKMIYKNDEAYNFGSVSNDKRLIALSKTHTRDNSDLYIYNITTGILKHISPHNGNINHAASTFSVDSKSLYYLTDADSEYKYLMKYNIDSETKEIVHKEKWDIWYNYFSHTGRYQVIGINADSRTQIKVFDEQTGNTVKLPKLPMGDISSVNISESERLMAFYHGGAKSPNNLYMFNLETGEYSKLTNTLSPDVNPVHLADGQVISYSSFDDMDIPAVYYKPPQIKKGDKIPALVWVHGGPGGQSRVGYRPLIQYLANHGYAIIAVNNRGSSGYGKTFQTLDDQAHGEGDLDDCVWAKDFLINTGYVDENKIGIIGGSYGGYMVMAALAFRPLAFEVGVNIFGVTNWIRTLKSIPPWWESARLSLYKELGDPNSQEEYLHSISPLFHADKIVKPVIVLQGANDPRVLQIESDEIVAAVKNNGVPVEYVVFDDEGHGFVKKANQIRGYKAILQFLDRYLKNSE